MKIAVDKDVCISAADCLAIAPDTFDLDAEGKAIVKEGRWDDLQTVLEAAKGCPVACIYVYDDAGVQLWPETGIPSEVALQEAKTQ